MAMRFSGAIRLLQRARAGASFEALQSSTEASRVLASLFTDASPRVTSLGSIAQAQVLSRSISTSVSTWAEPLTEVPVEGNVEAVLKEIDAVVSSESATGKEVADAAVSLAYLQAKGNRRVWGKVFERAIASKDSFDAASLSSFLWAATTAGVDHFKTVYELSGPVAAQLKAFSPSQLSLAVEALGKAHVKDAELFGKVADVVVADIGKFKPAELARILYGFGAACQQDARLVKAVSKALADKAGDLSAREASQAVWGLAKLRRSDKATLDALVRAAKGKLGAGESAVDAAALAWSLGFLAYKPDAETSKALGAALKAGAAELAPSHAIDAAWGLAVSGGADAQAVSALFSAIAAAVDKAPESFDVYQLGALYTAAALVPEAKLPEQVLSFSRKMYHLGAEAIRSKRPAAVQAFRDDVAEAAARASGARYRPEITAAVKGFAKATSDGIAVDIAVDLDASTKLAIEPVGPHCLSEGSGALLGPALARARLLESRGLKVVNVPISEWAALGGDAKAKAAYLLKAVKAQVPGAASKVDALQRKLEEPFDAFAE